MALCDFLSMLYKTHNSGFVELVTELIVFAKKFSNIEFIAEDG